MTTADLKLWQLQEAARSAIEQSAYFTALSGVPVIAEDGTKHDEIEQALSEDGSGAAVEVWEPYQGDTRDQAGTAVIVDSHVIVVIKVNPAANAKEGGANLKPMEAVGAIIAALSQRPRHAGGEFFRISDPAYVVLESDAGVREYAMEFTKETTL